MIDDVLNNNMINIIQYTRQYCVRKKLNKQHENPKLHLNIQIASRALISTLNCLYSYYILCDYTKLQTSATVLKVDGNQKPVEYNRKTNEWENQ